MTEWYPIPQSQVTFAGLPGWLLFLSSDGHRTVGTWTVNGQAVWTVMAGQA